MAEVQAIPDLTGLSDDNPNWSPPLGPLGLQDSNSLVPAPTFSDSVVGLISGLGNYVFRSESNFEEFGGQYQFTFLDDWYNRFHVVPSTINFGTFAEDTVGSTNIWNAYLVAQVATSAVAGAGDQGVTFTGPALPATFLPLQTLAVSFTAAGEGTPTVLESFTLNFTSGATALVGMIGVRIDPPEGILFDSESKVNWIDGFSVTEEWRTGIITSRDGSEQRDALRTKPRKTIGFQAAIKPADLRAFRRRCSVSARGRFYVTDQTRYVHLTVQAEATDTALVVDSVPSWAVAGEWVVMRHEGRVAMRQVLDVEDSNSVSGGTINFLVADDQVWPVGAKLHPALECEFEDETPTTRQTRQVVTVNFRLPVIPASEPDEDYGVAELTFDGREVFTLPVNWDGGINQQLLRPSELLDFLHGIQNRTFPDAVPMSEITSLPMAGSDNESSHAIRKFFHRHKGRQKEFYLSTGEPDLIAAEDLVNGQNILYIGGDEDGTAFVNNPSRRAIEVVLTDGTVLHRVVESITPAEDSNSVAQTQVTLTSGWPSDIATDEIERISWLLLCRFASDIINMNWPTNECGLCTLAAQTLKRVDSEA